MTSTGVTKSSEQAILLKRFCKLKTPLKEQIVAAVAENNVIITLITQHSTHVICGRCAEQFLSEHLVLHTEIFIAIVQHHDLVCYIYCNLSVGAKDFV